ncbi:HigA family addiction module antidote protein [Azoarcus indigens]|uniref:Addiction module HigA family antidote n=1 Tax=Azoarcus indigens TaxID=29545 RepID=A0A4V3BM86_9RHOO|nr:HigA family addiction module antitoxin [Azoarcus indigens]NMG65189.1 HigA family addiction module antidote protein [Azoarcus indigens]TDN49552.1 addiction module HigA family antidote [Azoarcus indigens]
MTLPPRAARPLSALRGGQPAKLAGGRPPTVRGATPAPSALRRPIHPGHFLETRFLIPARISQDALARALGISRRRVNELVRGRRAISPDTAVRLGRFFGTDPRFWTALQAQWDTFLAMRAAG